MNTLKAMNNNEKELGLGFYEACQHKRYSVDVHEQIGTCIDCGAEGRMQFVVNNTHPQSKKPLTRKQIDELADDGFFFGTIYGIVHAIEQAHGIKEHV